WWARCAGIAAPTTRARQARSATQDFLGRGTDAGVIRLRHARPSCRGWRSQRGTCGTRAGWRSMKTLRFHDEARRPSYYGASSRHAVARLQEICRAWTTVAALASPAAARRWCVLEAEHSRVRSAPQEVLGRAPSAQ